MLVLHRTSHSLLLDIEVGTIDFLIHLQMVIVPHSVSIQLLIHSCLLECLDTLFIKQYYSLVRDTSILIIFGLFLQGVLVQQEDPFRAEPVGAGQQAGQGQACWATPLDHYVIEVTCVLHSTFIHSLHSSAYIHQHIY